METKTTTRVWDHREENLLSSSFISVQSWESGIFFSPNCDWKKCDAAAKQEEQVERI